MLGRLKWKIEESILKPVQELGTTNFKERSEWIGQKLAEIKPGSRILDAGAGELFYKRFCDHLVYVSQDFAQYDGKGNSKGLQQKTWDQTRLDIVCDITSIPEPDSSFDAVLFSEVMEHLPHPFLALKELHRLLKPGGQLIISAPFCAMTHFAPHFYHTGFSRYYFETILKEIGFSIEEIKPYGTYFHCSRKN